METPSLPAELWILIASNPCLFKADLARLCTASFHLLNIVRPLLYRTLHLEAIDHESNSATVLALLAKDKSLARCVVELTLSRRLTFRDLLDDLRDLPRLVNVNALANMISLKRIALSNYVFRNRWEQNTFARLLVDIPLEELTYRSSGPLRQVSYSGLRGLPGDRFKGFGNVKKLVWLDREDCCALLHTLALFSH
jgi:hypothetical protein